MTDPRDTVGSASTPETVVTGLASLGSILGQPEGTGWHPYPNDRVAIEVDGLLVVVPRGMSEPTPLWCGLCGTLHRSREDEASHAEFGCCNRCGLEWAHARREQWKTGWRPTEEQVAEKVAERPPMSMEVRVHS